MTLYLYGSYSRRYDWNRIPSASGPDASMGDVRGPHSQTNMSGHRIFLGCFFLAHFLARLFFDMTVLTLAHANYIEVLHF